MKELPEEPRVDFQAIRERLAKTSGKTYWRSLEELSATEEFAELVEAEFPSAWQEPADRRKVLKLMAASFGLAGLTACASLPNRKTIPYVEQPEDVIPGKPLFFATAMQMGTRVTGLLAESHMGRPTKAEGNPDHPASLGATDIFSQASVLTLWDPDRSHTPVRGGDVSDWSTVIEQFQRIRAGLQTNRGAGFRLLTETVVSPTLGSQIQELLAEFPEAKWYQYEPVNRDAARTAALEGFGEDANPVYSVGNADVIVSLDADFLYSFPGSLAYARQFAERRRPDDQQSNSMNRLYATEVSPSVTGSNADHRLVLRSNQIPVLTRVLASRLGLGNADSELPESMRELTGWIEAVARDLEQHRGRSLVVAGEFQPEIVHLLAHAMNDVLGNVGSTVSYTRPIEVQSSDQNGSLRELVGELESGDVETLVMLGANPVYTAPADLDFAAAMTNAGLLVHAGLYEDETSELCHWHLPLSHFLETWSDTRGHDGTCSIVQPLIAPLYPSRSEHELLALLAGTPLETGHELVQAFWRRQRGEDGFEGFWNRSLHDGVIEDSAYPRNSLPFRSEAIAREEEPDESGDLEVVFRPDPTVYDGRFANNGWLQELPKPVTKLTWDNTAQLSPATAETLGLANEDVVELQYRGRTITAPVWIVPGHADDSVTVHLGYGRWRVGSVGRNAGFNAYSIRNSETPWTDGGLSLRKTGRRYALAGRQLTQNMENRDLVRVATLEEFQNNPRFAPELDEAPASGLTLYPGFESEGYKWGMSIDLNACIGCSACTIACQAENNIAVVGKQEVRRGRTMHWIRVDTYFGGAPQSPEMYHEPVPCMQCENAPCEVVCPVGATLHSDEGLNQMIYNRCVGTRYCSNNCPYKVRRFNFFQFSDYVTPSLKGMRNPDVTVRSRGVMEKCTYCVQRIQEAKITAETEGRTVGDGEIRTACQQVCPTQAIVFGDLNDPDSRVSQLKSLPRDYGLLVELNTRPRTTYLAAIKNPNPELEEG